METEPLDWRSRLEKAAALALPGTSVHRRLLLAILVLASMLRLWQLPHIPFTHDEISALLRVRFHAFSELINQGVAVDAHPAGVQVFEWLWVGLFGTGEVAVKLPFILFSVASLFFLYRFAAAWATPAASLLSIAFIGTIQYTVMYGQIARPYAAGSLACALLVDQLTRAIAGHRRAWVGAAVAMALCAYIHHFSMLFAALAWFCFLPIARKNQRKDMLLSGAAALLLYAPHISITIRQYGYKGVGLWLAPPAHTWLPDYAAWLFEYSIPLAVVVIGTALAGWSRVFRSRIQITTGPFLPLCLLLGVTPLAVGYGYSLWRAPVLQYSVVLFSFPFLVFPLFAGWRAPKPALLTLLTGLIVLTAVHGLVFVRKHYTVFYHSKYEVAVHGIIAASKERTRLALVDMPAEIPGFYFTQWMVDSTTVPYFNIRSRSPDFTDSLMRTTNASSVFLGISAGAAPEKQARVRAAFPFLAARHDMVEGQAFLLTARPNGNHLNDRSHQSTLAPEAVLGEGWDTAINLPVTRDTTASSNRAPLAWDMAGHEFGLVYEHSLYDLGAAGNDILEASMDVADAPNGSELKLVMELVEGDRQVAYTASSAHVGTTRILLLAALPLSDLPLHGQGCRLRVYAWNPSKQQARINSINVDVLAGNPWLYALFQPLRLPLAFP